MLMRRCRHQLSPGSRAVGRRQLSLQDPESAHLTGVVHTAMARSPRTVIVVSGQRDTKAVLVSNTHRKAGFNGGVSADGLDRCVPTAADDRESELALA
jgi:hypothetical protein